MTKNEAKNVLMDTFTKAQCSECYVADALVPNNCNEYCDAYKQFKEAIAVLEKSDDSKSFSDSAEPSKVDYRTDESANIGTEVKDERREP